MILDKFMNYTNRLVIYTNYVIMTIISLLLICTLKDCFKNVSFHKEICNLKFNVRLFDVAIFIYFRVIGMNACRTNILAKPFDQ